MIATARVFLLLGLALGVLCSVQHPLATLGGMGAMLLLLVAGAMFDDAGSRGQEDQEP